MLLMKVEFRLWLILDKDIIGMLPVLNHDETGGPTGKADVINQQLSRLFHKLDQYRDEITLYQTFDVEDAEYLLISFGCSTRSSLAAVELLRNEGIKVGLLQLQTIWPFPDHVIKDFTKIKRVFLLSK